MTSQNNLFGGGLFENLSNVFEKDPQGLAGLYGSRLNESGLSQRQKTGMYGQFENTFQGFLGTLGDKIRSGTTPGPDDTFNNYLNNFNPQRQALQLQGQGGGGFGPTMFDFGR